MPRHADEEKLVREKWRLVKPTMDERARRRWAGTEPARSATAAWRRWRATGMAISAVRKGRDEARAGARRDDVVRIRRSGGKRPLEALRLEVWPAIEKLIDPPSSRPPRSASRVPSP